jgi:hypothetical protein
MKWGVHVIQAAALDHQLRESLASPQGYACLGPLGHCHLDNTLILDASARIGGRKGMQKCNTALPRYTCHMMWYPGDVNAYR